jgi:squalene cyclase
MHWLFPDVDAGRLDGERDLELILPRVLERGRMADVRWCVRRYGYAGIHRFLRDVGHPELTPRTLRFWRLVLGVDENETWATTPSWRRASAEPWHG